MLMINNKPNMLLNKFYKRCLKPFKLTKRGSYLFYKILNAESGNTKRIHFTLLKAASCNKMREDIGYDAPAKETK